ncbi:MAG: hypothetical protein APR54_04465, partial [Candidatus Cloacimonas sp. SDB]
TEVLSKSFFFSKSKIRSCSVLLITSENKKQLTKHNIINKNFLKVIICIFLIIFLMNSKFYNFCPNRKILGQNCPISSKVIYIIYTFKSFL